ncbi:MAG: hypothetical protein K2H23_00765 [Oscillospiraceae bacterium]|nr:hypothetical protein [Oscillospiraceae bacterium]
MEDFRKQVKKTLNIYTAVLIAAIVIFVTLNIVEITGILSEKSLNDLSNGFGTGVCTAIIVFMAIAICRYHGALKNDEKLKKLYILETDERERLIYEKTNSASFRTVIILLGFAAMVASFFSKTIFYTIVAIIMVIAFVQVVFKFYYRRKF